jgi:hypothetical protein
MACHELNGAQVRVGTGWRWVGRTGTDTEHDGQGQELKVAAGPFHASH